MSRRKPGAPMLRFDGPLWFRFAMRVRFGDPDECWLWTGATNKDGYGLIQVGGGQSALVHRVAYELLVGPIPEGLTVDHLCFTRACVNPAHFDAVPLWENIARRTARRLTCKNGHLWAENAFFWPSEANRRRCRACEDARNERRYGGVA